MSIWKKSLEEGNCHELIGIIDSSNANVFYDKYVDIIDEMKDGSTFCLVCEELQEPNVFLTATLVELKKYARKKGKNLLTGSRDNNALEDVLGLYKVRNYLAIS